MFNETDFGGRKLIVAEAKPMEKREFTPRPGGDNRGGGYSNDRNGSDRRPSSGGRPSFGSGRRDSRGFSRGGGRGGFNNQ